MRHDKAFIGVVVVQPIMMLLLFGGALSNEPANVPWAVLDQSQSGRRAPPRRGDRRHRLLPRAATRRELRRRSRAARARRGASRWW